MKLSIDELARATGAKRADAAKFCDALNVAMDRYQINTPKRVAAFLATVAIESRRLETTEEGLFYKDAARLAAIFPRAFKDAAAAAPYVRNPKGLSELLYQGFHGRGLIQLSWERNYRAAGAALGQDFVSTPDMLLSPKHAAMSAAWYWAENGCNQWADRGNMGEVTRRVNGPARLHLVERTAQYVANLGWLGQETLA